MPLISGCCCNIAEARSKVWFSAVKPLASTITISGCLRSISARKLLSRLLVTKKSASWKTNPIAPLPPTASAMSAAAALPMPLWSPVTMPTYSLLARQPETPLSASTTLAPASTAGWNAAAPCTGSTTSVRMADGLAAMALPTSSACRAGSNCASARATTSMPRSARPFSAPAEMALYHSPEPAQSSAALYFPALIRATSSGARAIAEAGAAGSPLGPVSGLSTSKAMGLAKNGLVGSLARAGVVRSAAARRSANRMDAVTALISTIPALAPAGRGAATPSSRRRGSLGSP